MSVAGEVLAPWTSGASSPHSLVPNGGKDVQTAVPADIRSTPELKSPGDLVQAFAASGGANPAAEPGQPGLDPVLSGLTTADGIELHDNNDSNSKNAAVGTRPVEEAQIVTAAPAAAAPAAPAAPLPIADAPPNAAPAIEIGSDPPSKSVRPGGAASGPQTVPGLHRAEALSGDSATVVAGTNLAPHPGEAMPMGIRAEGRGWGPEQSAEDVLTRMDSGATAVAPRLAEHSVAVGIDDPAHGWIEVRAQGIAGQVAASLAAASPEAHLALHAQLPAMAQYLAERDLGVRSVMVSGGPASAEHPAANLSHEGPGQGPGGGFGDQGGSGFSPGAQGNSDKSAKTEDRVPGPGSGGVAGRLAGEPGGAAIPVDSVRGAGRLINVRA